MRAVLAGEASEASPWAKAEDSPLLVRPYARPLRLQAGRGAGQSRSPLLPHYSGVFPADLRSWAGLDKIKVSPGKMLIEQQVPISAKRS